MFGSALLLYPDGRFTGRADRLVIAATGVAFGPLMTLSILASEPEWNGYAADAWWPSPLRSATLFGAISDAFLVINPLLALSFLVLMVRRVRGLPRPERSVAAPVLVVVGAALVAAALLAQPIEADDLARVLRGVALQGVALLAFPLVLLVATGRRALAAATAADRVLRLAGPATVRSIRAALRTVLQDPTVEIFFRLPDTDGQVDRHGRDAGRVDDDGDAHVDGNVVDDGHRRGYVDVDGRPADPAAATRGGRWSRTVHTRTGDPLAVVTGDPALGRHTAFADAALRAGRLALENAQLQVAVQARLVETRAVQARIAGAEAEQRRRMARDLQDGVRRRLLDLAVTADAAEAAAADPDASSSALRRLREGLIAANQEVRAVGRGLHPQVRPQVRPPRGATPRGGAGGSGPDGEGARWW
jgi:signal transduction histidine kinase